MAASGGDRLVILDGGTGRELKRRGVPVPETIWSANALFVAPEIVLAVHRDYLAAGADVITTNNYTVTPAILALDGLDACFEELTRLAGQLARAAADSVGGGKRVAGCLPPLLGSYRPDLLAPEDERSRLYGRIAALLAPFVDLFLCETMATPEEARTAAAAATATGKPVWVSWTVDDGAEGPPSGLLRGGHSLAEAVGALDGLAVEAVLVNCSPPEAIDAAMPALRAAAGGRAFGGYANAFAPVPKTWRLEEAGFVPSRDVPPERYRDHARTWHAGGARIVGGCCGIGPEHIALVKSALAA